MNNKPISTPQNLQTVSRDSQPVTRASKTQPVQSLIRALDILEFAARHEEGISLNDIAELLEVSQGAAFNLSSTLVSRGYLNKTTRPVRFTLGDTLIDLGMRQAESRWIRDVATIMQELAAQFANINTLFVTPSTYQLMASLRTDPTQPGIVQRPARVLDNPYSLISAIVLLAFLDEGERSRIFQRYPFDEFASQEYPSLESFRDTLNTIREQGYAIATDRKPRVACPVYDRNGQLRGCLGISLYDTREDSSHLPILLDTLQQKLAELNPSGKPLQVQITPT